MKSVLPLRRLFLELPERKSWNFIGTSRQKSWNSKFTARASTTNFWAFITHHLIDQPMRRSWRLKADCVVGYNELKSVFMVHSNWNDSRIIYIPLRNISEIPNKGAHKLHSMRRDIPRCPYQYRCPSLKVSGDLHQWTAWLDHDSQATRYLGNQRYSHHHTTHDNRKTTHSSRGPLIAESRVNSPSTCPLCPASQQCWSIWERQRKELSLERPGRFRRRRGCVGVGGRRGLEAYIH